MAFFLHLPGESFHQVRDTRGRNLSPADSEHLPFLSVHPLLIRLSQGRAR